MVYANSTSGNQSSKVRGIPEALLVSWEVLLILSCITGVVSNGAAIHTLHRSSVRALNRSLFFILAVSGLLVTGVSGPLSLLDALSVLYDFQEKWKFINRIAVVFHWFVQSLAWSSATVCSLQLAALWNQPRWYMCFITSAVYTAVLGLANHLRNSMTLVTESQLYLLLQQDESREIPSSFQISAKVDTTLSTILLFIQIICHIIMAKNKRKQNMSISVMFHQNTSVSSRKVSEKLDHSQDGAERISMCEVQSISSMNFKVSIANSSIHCRHDSRTEDNPKGYVHQAQRISTVTNYSTDEFCLPGMISYQDTVVSGMNPSGLLQDGFCCSHHTRSAHIFTIDEDPAVDKEGVPGLLPFFHKPPQTSITPESLGVPSYCSSFSSRSSTTSQSSVSSKHCQRRISRHSCSLVQTSTVARYKDVATSTEGLQCHLPDVLDDQQMLDTRAEPLRDQEGGKSLVVQEAWGVSDERAVIIPLRTNHPFFRNNTSPTSKEKILHWKTSESSAAFTFADETTVDEHDFFDLCFTKDDRPSIPSSHISSSSNLHSDSQHPLATATTTTEAMAASEAPTEQQFAGEAQASVKIRVIRPSNGSVSGNSVSKRILQRKQNIFSTVVEDLGDNTSTKKMNTCDSADQALPGSSLNEVIKPGGRHMSFASLKSIGNGGCGKQKKYFYDTELQVGESSRDTELQENETTNDVTVSPDDMATAPVSHDNSHFLVMGTAILFTFSILVLRNILALCLIGSGYSTKTLQLLAAVMVVKVLSHVWYVVFAQIYIYLHKTVHKPKEETI